MRTASHESTLLRPLLVTIRSTSRRSSSSSSSTANDVRSLWERFRRRVQQSLARPFWRRLAIFVRYTRIPLLVASVYSLGYQQGIVDCTKTPLALQSQILQSILMSMGIVTVDDTTVQVIQETMFTPRMLMKNEHAQIAHVGHNIVCAARLTVQEELEKALGEAHKALPSDIAPEQAQIHVQNHPGVQFWYAARERLMGEEVSNQPWQYVLVSSPSPNAFVTEILPRRFFLTTSLLKVATSPDELAVVLGHESTSIRRGMLNDWW
jgi:Zn-dependent protease with chaperone function